MAHRFIRIGVQASLIKLGLFLVTSAFASDVQLTGSVRYSIQGGEAVLTASEISNFSYTWTTGTLFLSLWATESPNPYTSGYLVARGSVGEQLSPRAYLTDISVTTDFTAPPDGTYYMHFYVSEYPLFDTVLDLVTFTGTETFSSYTPPPPVIPEDRGVEILGSVGYSIRSGEATLTASEISNFSYVWTTGTLYLSLWATESPDPYTSGYLVARGSVGEQLSPRAYLTDISVTTDFTAPPDGTYYMHFYVSEYPLLNTVLDLVTFTGTETFSFYTPPPPVIPEDRGVEILGRSDYEFLGNSVRLLVDEIRNDSLRQTGVLHLSLIATEVPEITSRSHLVARVSLAGFSGGGRLDPGQSYYGIDLTANYLPPPPGEYYLHILVSDLSDPDTMLDSRTDPNVFKVGVKLIGNVNYRIDENEETVILGVDEIFNDSSRTTDMLFLTLRLTDGPSAESSGYDVARVSLEGSGRSGRLSPRGSYTNLSLTTDFIAPPAGVYWVHVYVSDASNPSKQLDVRSESVTYTVTSDDHADSFEEATEVIPPHTLEASLEISGDVDVFRLELETEGTLRVFTDGWTDTYGSLIDGVSKQAVVIDDDSGTFLNFDFERELQPGIWYVQVKGALRFTSGNYDVYFAFEPKALPSERPRFSQDRALGDFNGDGKSDVMLRHEHGHWYYFAMDGGMIIQEESGETPVSTDLRLNLAGVGDFDGDRKDDVLLRNFDGRWQLFAMNGDEVIEAASGYPELTSDLEYIVAGIGDFNGDGRDDVLMRHQTLGTWMLYAMNGFIPLDGESGPANLTRDLTYSVVGIGDFNGDGRDDVLLRRAEGGWHLYVMQGRKIVFGSGPVSGLPSGLGTAPIALGDYDADGMTDILVGHVEGEWHLYRMNGRQVRGGEGSVLEMPELPGYELAGVGDLDGDSSDDLLLRHGENGSWHFLALDGHIALSPSSPVNLFTDLAWQLPVQGEPSQLETGKVFVRLRIAEGQSMDSDTRDALREKAGNDTLDSAQFELVPATIAGYASAYDDQLDIYRLAFPAPVRIGLAIADAEEADLDLYLARPDGAIIEQSLGVDDLEAIQSSIEGEHLVVVSAYNGASNYSLVVSFAHEQSPEGAQMAINRTWSRDGEFVPRELLVMAAPNVSRGTSDRAESRGEAMKRVAASFALQDVDFIGNNRIRTAPDRQFTEHTQFLEGAGFRFDSKLLRDKAATLMLRKRMVKNSEAVAVQPNYVLSASVRPDDPEYDRQEWHYQAVSLEAAWGLTTGSDDVVVAVVDTGVATDHPDLSARLLRDAQGGLVGYDFISDPEIAQDGDGIDSNPHDVGDGGVGLGSSSFHGTHVAGTVAATTNNGVGVAGVLWKGKVMPVRVLGKGGGYTSDVIEGIRYAAGLANASESLPSKRADVINLSLGQDNRMCIPLPENPAVSAVLREVIESGVVVVHAAGNNNCFFTDYWSAVPGVITVGAVNSNEEKAHYSNYGERINVVAPGGGFSSGVVSTMADDASFPLRHTYRGYVGTSMAAPHVAGIVGLMLSVNPALTPGDINDLIAGTHSDPSAAAVVRDLGVPGKDFIYGEGIIDAYRAVRTAKAIVGGSIDDAPTAPRLRVAPAYLNFGDSAQQLRVRTENIGGGELHIESANTEQSWIEVSREYLPDLVIQVNRENQPEGTLSGEVLIRSNGGEYRLGVSAQVRSVARPSNVGTIWVGLLDPDTYRWQDWKALTPEGGYSYESSDVPPGNYWVIAGTNRDGDNHICDAGEACGMYPLVGAPRTIRVDGDQRVKFGVSIDLFSRISSQSLESTSIGAQGFKIPEHAHEK